MMPMMDGSMMGWAWVWLLLVLIGVVLLGYVAFRLVRGSGRSTAVGGPSSPRQILDERYARGEIDDEEYRHRRAELS